MYIPQAFRMEDLKEMQDFIQNYNFGIIISQQENTPIANHLPFILKTDQGPYGTLLAHFARQNTQWQTFNKHQEVLAVFSGPHSYISPSWYTTPVSVPTWNFVTVHAYGVPYLIHEENEVYQILNEQVQSYEAHFEQPWQMPSPNDYIQKLMKNIVVFALPITRIEGKQKLSQNRSVNDRNTVIQHLQQEERSESHDIVHLMKKNV